MGELSRQSTRDPVPLSGPQMTMLSCLAHTAGELLLVGSDLRPAARLVELGYAERTEGRWHRATYEGRRAFVRLRAQEDTREGAAARRLLARGEFASVG